MTAAASRVDATSTQARRDGGTGARQQAPGRVAATLAAASAATFLLLLALLHVLRPELHPSWRVISEYAIGRHGWMMSAAFLLLALACATLGVALRPHLRGIAGWVGLALLAVSAVGMAMAGVFTTDPLTAAPDAATAHGRLHELGAMLDVTPIAAVFLVLALRRNPAWAYARRSLLWITGVLWLGLLGFIASAAILLPRNGGRFGPEVWIGWPNRIMIAAYCAWIIHVALLARRAAGAEHR